jgi:hypothetical protein
MSTRWVRRFVVALIAVAVSVALLANPAEAAPSWNGQTSYFGCSTGELIVDVPDGSFFSQSFTWWIPQVFSYDGAGWVQAGWGHYHYSYYGLGVDIGVTGMTNYDTGVTENFDQIPVTPGYYYAVVNHVWSRDSWFPGGVWANAATANGQPTTDWWCLA